ncbi:hypothetical protein IWW57_003684 [Coemansia sp. S610]|nr:hypothetical protein IWW57_003684 [Coemansia sp. S610]
MKFYFSIGLAGVLAALALALRLARAEMARLTETSGLDLAPTTTNAYAYRWWDAFTNHAADLVNYKASCTSSMLSHAQHGMAESDKYMTSDASKQAVPAKDSAECLEDDGHKEQREDAPGRVEYAGIHVQDEAVKPGHVAKQGVGGIKQQAGNGATQAAKRVKHVGQTVHSRVPADEGRLALSVESTSNVIRSQGKWLHSVYSRLTDHIETLGSATRGASSQLRSKLGTGLSKLNDLASTDAVSTWLESMVAGGDKEAVTRYIQDLYRMSQQAHAQLEAKLETQGAVLKSIADSYMRKQLPLAGLYGSLATLMLVYLVSTIWCHRADMSHRMRQLAEAVATEAGTARMLQHESISAMEAIVAVSVYLAIVPMVTVLLVVMELNGSPSWLVVSSYTCLLAGMLVAANPALLAGIWPGDDMGNAEQRLAVGIAMFIAVSCLAQTVHG